MKSALLFCALLIMTACKKKETDSNGNLPDTDTISAVDTGSFHPDSGYHVVIDTTPAGFAVYAVAPDDRRALIAEGKDKPSLYAGIGRFAWALFACGPGCTESYFVSLESAKSWGPYRDVIAAERNTGVFASIDQDRVTLRKIDSGDAWLALVKPHGSNDPLPAFLNSPKLDGQSFSYCIAEKQTGKNQCHVLPFAFGADAQPFACAGGEGAPCPTFEADLDGDGRKDSLQFVSVARAPGFRPSLAMQNPWSTTALTIPEKLSVRVTLSSQPGTVHLLHNASYFASPDWDSPSGWLKNLSLVEKDLAPFPEMVENAGPGPQGDQVSFPTQAGPTMQLYWNGKHFGVLYPEGDED